MRGEKYDLEFDNATDVGQEFKSCFTTDPKCSRWEAAFAEFDENSTA